MSEILTELVVIILLLVVNGIFAMSELAIVTSRKVRLEHRADDGSAGARAALALAQDPTQFLSTVQVGITLIGVLAGAFGGATVSEELAVILTRFPSIAEYAEPIALGVVVTGITYLSLLIGELIPKRIALSRPELIASIVARPMTVLARAASPVVALLTGPTNLVLRLFGIRMSAEPSITVEEIRALVEQGAESGVLEDAEHGLVERVFRLGDRAATDVMIPRVSLDWVDLNDPTETIRAQLAAKPTSRYLFCEGSIENVVGVARAEELLAHYASGSANDLRSVLSEPLYVPGGVAALDLLERLRSGKHRAAVVLDEFGGMQGLVTMDEMVDAMLGELHIAPTAVAAPATQQRDDHTWVMRGSVPIEDVEHTLDLEIATADRGGAHTLGGFLMTLLARIPKEGDLAEYKGTQFVVSRMAGRRVDSVVARSTKHA